MTENLDLISFCHRSYRLAPAQIGMLRFLLEGYDGLLFLRTIDSKIAVVELSWSKSCAPDAEAILFALSAELNMVVDET